MASILFKKITSAVILWESQWNWMDNAKVIGFKKNKSGLESKIAADYMS
jgi:hypothetical protein